MGGGDDRQDMWCRREVNVKLADTVRIMPYSAAIPAHEVREGASEPWMASMHRLRPSDINTRIIPQYPDSETMSLTPTPHILPSVPPHTQRR